MARAVTQGDFQALQFDLGAETYCIDIDHIEEIVDATDRTLTPLPNQPPHVKGIVDLRGRTTTVVDPKIALGVSDGEAGTRIVVFDSDDGVTVGWMVDEARQVIDVVDDEVDRRVEDDGVLGIVRGTEEGDGDEEFVIWVDPAAVHG